MNVNPDTSSRHTTGTIAAYTSIIAIAEYYVPFVSFDIFLGNITWRVTDMFGGASNSGGVVLAVICSVILLVSAIVQCFKSSALLTFLSAICTSSPLFFVLAMSDDGGNVAPSLEIGFIIAFLSTAVLAICCLIQYIYYIRSMRHPWRVALIGLSLIVFYGIFIVVSHDNEYVEILLILTMWAVPVGVFILISALLGAIFSTERKAAVKIPEEAGPGEDACSSNAPCEKGTGGLPLNVLEVGDAANAPDAVSVPAKEGNGKSWPVSRKIGVGIVAIVALLALVAGIFIASRDNDTPFVGTWQLHSESKTPEGYVDCVYDYTLWLDFNDASVTCGDTARVLGIIYACEDCAGYCAATEDIITAAKTDGNTAYIKYRHEETGEIWSATLTYDPKTASVTFVNGEMLEKGPGTPPDDAPVYASDFEGRIFYVEPDSVTLSYVSNDPNHVFMTEEDSADNGIGASGAFGADDNAACAEETMQEEAGGQTGQFELADRIFYCAFSQVDGTQLKCRFKATGEEIVVVNEDGECPLIGVDIYDAWPTTDGSGMLIVSDSRGVDLISYSLIKVDAENRVTLLDECTGLNPGSTLVSPEQDVNEVMPSIERDGDKIIVRLAGEHCDETHYYDMDGNRL